MIRQVIRFNTFETNSSSTHSMCIVPDKDWEAWRNGDLYFMRWTYGEENKKLLEENNNSRMFTKEFLISKDKDFVMPQESEFDDCDDYDDAMQSWLDDSDFINIVGWDNIDLEENHEEYTTESGEKIHILCKFGYDY